MWFICHKLEDKFEDIKVVMRSRQLNENREYNNQKKKK
jgi:hypothetical protein